MKLVEVVVLIGAQCISPVQTTAGLTEAAKVQCAVVIEKDTIARTIRIVPAAASTHPQVTAVLERLDNTAPAGAMIEPAAAPPTPAPAARTPLASPALQPAPETTAAGAAPAEAAEVAVPAEAKVSEKDTKLEAKAPAPRKAKAPKDQASAKPSSQCLGSAKPKWYTNAEGRRKYRCVKAG
jgi:hypothetical protein